MNFLFDEAETLLDAVATLADHDQEWHPNESSQRRIHQHIVAMDVLRDRLLKGIALIQDTPFEGSDNAFIHREQTACIQAVLTIANDQAKRLESLSEKLGAL